MPRDRPATIATDRRRFLAAAGLAVAGSVNLSGCSALSRTLAAPSVDWRTELGTRRWVNSPMALLDGRLLASGENRLVALDATSGDHLWQSSIYFEHVVRGPVVVDSVAVIADKRRAGYRSDGTATWSHNAEDRFTPYAAVNDGFVVGGSNTADGAITAIDTTDGHILWERTPTNWDNRNGQYAAFDAVGTAAGIVAVDFNGPLAGLSRNGSIEWTRDDWDVPGPGRPRLAATNDLAVAASGAIIGMNPATGDRHWRQVLPDWASGVTIADGVAFVSLGSDSPKVDAWEAAGGVLAYDLADGTERWRTPLPHPASAPAVDGDEVLVGTREGLFTGIDVENGERRWERNLGSYVDTAPLVREPTTYVGVRNGEGSPEIVAMAR